MKYKLFFYLTVFALVATCLTVFPNGAIKGAIEGINLCYKVIFPSLFPFMVISILIYKIVDCAQFSKNAKSIFIIFLISLIGGYPVGAKLIEQAYANKNINKKSAEKMLGFCVNSGPSYIIIAVGSGILRSKLMGLILFLTNIIACIIILLFSINKIEINKKEQNNLFILSDELVSATYDASCSMISICSFIIFFSSLSGTINGIFTSHNNILIKFTNLVLEVTNGIINAEGNVLIISFLLGFSGLCVHFQILSVCKTLKPNYLKFLFYRILHGTLSSILTLLLIKIFKIPYHVIAINTEYFVQTSKYSAIFSIALISCSIVFIASVRKNNKIL